MTAPAEVCARAPAKINLELRVGGLRVDGHHELATVYQAVSLFDDVIATEADEVSITVEGVHADGVPQDETNLAIRAARLLAGRTGIDAGVRLRVRKAIPVAAGMGGGSADAAAALLACDSLWRAGLSREALAELAAELGSDVPFALHGGTAVGTGRGERLTSALARGEYHWVVALSDHGLSTPAVYAELDRLRTGRVLAEPRVSDRLMQALRSADPIALGATLHNDMQPAACSLAPDLERLLEVGRDYGAAGWLVSGSGPTVALLARDAEQALDLAVALTSSGLAGDVRRVLGPVSGARLVEPVRG
jgi:4-diphosphocytidyl-2-C-methyl-D-erythritol kinase